MGIYFNEKEKLFHLYTDKTSYMLQVYDTGHVAHVYWGKRVRQLSFQSESVTSPRSFDPNDPELNPDVIAQEYAGFGVGDFRSPSYQVMIPIEL